MAWVIVAGVLGVIIICGGLFLRRLLRQLAELRRQITWFDRQMRAQRARVTFLRQLIAEDEEGDGDGEPPPLADVVNGNSPSGPPDPPDAATPVRRKGHLGLYLGGAVAAAVAVGTAARQIGRQYGTQLTASAAAAAIVAATATLIIVQPWSTDNQDQSPAIEPSAAPTATYRPPPGARRSPSPTVRPPRSSHPSASPSTAGAFTPSAAPPSRAAPATGRGDSGIDAVLPSRPGRRRGHSRGTPPPGRTRRPTPPRRTRRPRPTPSESSTPAVSVGVAVAPLVRLDVCVVCR